MQDRPEEEFVYAEDDEPEGFAEEAAAGGAGRPGPADEVAGRPSTEGVAGRPGPADEVDGRPSTEGVAGAPGPADEVDRSG